MSLDPLRRTDMIENQVHGADDRTADDVSVASHFSTAVSAVFALPPAFHFGNEKHVLLRSLKVLRWCVLSATDALLAIARDGLDWECIGTS